MDRYKFSLMGVGLALVYWFAESVIHRFVYAEASFEIVPSEPDEFQMRLLIILLIVAFGFFADNRARKIKRTEQEKHKVYVATVRSSQHILNNLMNQMQLAFLDLDRENCLESETRKLLERSIRESKKQVELLSSVSDVSSESIEDSIRPK